MLQCVADVLQMCCRCVADVMQRVAHVLQMCCRGTKKKPAKNCERLHVCCSVLQRDAVCPQVCCNDVRSLAFIEEYWRLPPQQSNPLCSAFGCVRLYSTDPKVYYIIDTWRSLGPAPIICNAVHPTIPYGQLPQTQAQ